MKHNVWLAQVNFQYGANSLFLPYSVGSLEAYARAQEEIESTFQFRGYVYRRDPINDVIARIAQSGGVSVFGISCYIWNWEYSRTIADAVRKYWPECLIVIGGPQVTRQSDKGDDNHANGRDFESADIAVFGEGEHRFVDILRVYTELRNHPKSDWTIISSNRLRNGDSRREYAHIKGLELLSDQGSILTGDAGRITDLSTLPSPYLQGCFDALLADRTTDWQASLETNRGCPYSCSFCAWGPESLAKIHQFPDERIIKELQWCGEQKIRYVYSCDANYGILKRDIDLTRVLVETKKLYSFPQEFRACTAKNSNDRVFEISQILNDAGMCKGATLSFQSMDPHTLQIIKRKNIKTDDFRERLQLYRQHGIATYTELIMGLPGESLESFKGGIDTILDAGKHEGMNIYLCQVLPETDFSDPAYRETHGIKSIRSPILMQHSAPITDPHQEYNDIVIGTATMDAIDWGYAYMFAWAVQTFHCLGLARMLAIFAHAELGLSYSAFYDMLLGWASTHCDTNIGRSYWRTLDIMKRGMSGGDWGFVDQRFGNIVWPTEEYSFLAIVAEHETVANELRAFMQYLLYTCSYNDSCLTLLNALIDYQQAIIIRPDDCHPRILELPFNCHEFSTQVLNGQDAKFCLKHESLIITPRRSYASLEEYARLVCWYGRKGGRFMQSDIIHYTKE